MVKSNWFRFGKKVIDSIRSKISKSFKGRIQSETEKLNHVLGAHKKQKTKTKTKQMLKKMLKKKKKFIVMIGILIIYVWYLKSYEKWSVTLI